MKLTGENLFVWCNNDQSMNPILEQMVPYAK